MTKASDSAERADVLFTLTPDCTFLTVRGIRYAFTGPSQRAFIRQLYDAWRSGDPELQTAEALKRAGYRPSANTLAKAFSRRPDIRDFTREENGRCWLFLR